MPSSSLQRLSTSDMNLNKVQVASSLDVCLGKYVIIRLLPGKSVIQSVTVSHRLLVRTSGQCSACFSVVVSLFAICYYISTS